MLWRPAYRTLVARNFTVPDLLNSGDPLPRFQVLVGGFDFRAYREMGIWKRLLISESPSPLWIQGFFLEEVSTESLDLLDSLVPPSDRGQTYCFPDENGSWRDLVSPNQPEQSFAAVLQENRALIMMKGIPTEDAWDAFRNELAVGY